MGRLLLYPFAFKKCAMHAEAAMAIVLTLTDHSKDSFMEIARKYGREEEVRSRLKAAIAYHEKKEKIWFKVMLFSMKF